MRAITLKKYIVLLLICLCASLFFLGLFHFDNKYQQGTVQAANGVLALSEEDLEAAPLRYLVNGWTYYPNALLTPEDIQKSDHYATYLSIGEQTHFTDSTGQSPFGCGTYQMTFYLPHRQSGYALEIPEVFSAYRLYLNNQLVLQMGDPTAGTSSIQNRMVTFEGGTPVTLTLAVRNYAHFYGGMIYPPAFGTMIAVNTVRGIRLVVALFGATLTLLFALLSFYLSWRMKQKDALLFATICLTMGSMVCVPVWHMLVALPIFPWYALELGTIYLLLLLIVLLQNRLCQSHFLPMAISNTIAALFFLGALGYGFLSSHLNITALKLFSAAVFCYKIFLSGYLLYISLRAVQKGKTTDHTIFYANVIATFAVVWDRLRPNYEPIIGGWFIEWGIFFIVVAIGASLWHNVVAGYSNSLIFDEERKQISRQLAMQTEYNRQNSTAIEENRRLIHDIKHHLRTIDHLATTQRQSELCRYLSQVEQQVTTTSNAVQPPYCSHPAVNALIGCYAGMAQQHQTDFQVQLELSDNVSLSDVEWCTLLGNLLDNAVEACARQQQEPRRILVAGALHGNQYFLKVENTYDGKIIPDHHRLLSRKGRSPYHGIGLSSVQQIIDAHNGELDIMPGNKSFIVGITLPL